MKLFHFLALSALCSTGCTNNFLNDSYPPISPVEIDIIDANTSSDSETIITIVKNVSANNITLYRCGFTDPLLYAIFTGYESDKTTLQPLCEAIENTAPLVLKPGEQVRSISYFSRPTSNWQNVQACLTLDDLDFCSAQFSRPG